MNSYSYSQFNTSRGLTYSYIHLAPAQGSLGPYILFLHGFPSSSYDWRYQIEYFTQKRYGIIVPDLLGYVSELAEFPSCYNSLTTVLEQSLGHLLTSLIQGETSKPLDTGLYNGKGMSEDIKELLGHLKVDKVHGVGHDW
jgi:soluble epoxide hydrolase / lipid-phosphate phosphatase